MSLNRILVIISHSDPDCARAGFMWATNALKLRWVDDVEVILFGGIEKTLAEGEEEVIEWVKGLHELGKALFVCRKIAEDGGIVTKLEELNYNKLGGGIVLEYVGRRIAELIKEGYVPLVF
ncbi:MAG: hypothetical protein RXS42_06905 [Nitrososphaeria archaeon]